MITSHLHFQPCFNNQLGFFLLSCHPSTTFKGLILQLATASILLAEAPKIKEQRKPTCKSFHIVWLFVSRTSVNEKTVYCLLFFSSRSPIFGGTSDRLFFQTLKLTETGQEIPINSGIKSCWTGGFFWTFAPTRKSFRSFRPSLCKPRNHHDTSTHKPLEGDAIENLILFHRHVPTTSKGKAQVGWFWSFSATNKSDDSGGFSEPASGWFDWLFSANLKRWKNIDNFWWFGPSSL